MGKNKPKQKKTIDITSFARRWWSMSIMNYMCNRFELWTLTTCCALWKIHLSQANRKSYNYYLISAWQIHSKWMQTLHFWAMKPAYILLRSTLNKYTHLVCVFGFQFVKPSYNGRFAAYAFHLGKNWIPTFININT